MGTPTRSTFFPPNATVTETPVKSKATRTLPAFANGLEEGRKAVMSDLGFAIPSVPISYFETALLPPLRAGLSVDDIIIRLQQAGHLNDAKRWTKLFKKRPSEASHVEDEVFSDFERIASAVRRAADDALTSWAAASSNNKQDVRPTAVFECNPAMTPESESRFNTSKPDSFAHLYRGAAFAQPITLQRCALWDDIVVPGEFKKKTAVRDINDNNSKVMWSMNHVMRESLRRRFVFGYTIEDIHMRLWFLSRSDALVSKDFDFLEDCRTLIHFLLSIMYAQPEELGYDITMRRVSTTDATPQYDISVFTVSKAEPKPKQHSYRTRRIVSNIGAEAARGRGTRVWEVVRLDEQGSPIGPARVLKDCWIDHDRTREGDLMKRILDSAKTEAMKSKLKDYFLTVECHGDVYINGKPDDTCALMRRGHAAPKDEYYLLKQPTLPTDKTVDQRLYPVDPPPSMLQPNGGEIIEYDDKYHYRIVFEELGTSIDKLNSAVTIFRCLSKTVLGLQALHQCGWVHRDISMGNILIVDGKPKIADLEYAKRLDDNSKVHQARTGTECFMPIEIKSQVYEFLSRADDESDDDSDDDSDDGDDDSDDANVSAAAGDEEDGDDNAQNSDLCQVQEFDRWDDLPVPSPRYNPIHDLEGFWWTSLILTVYRKLLGVPKKPPRAEDADTFWRFMQKVFEVFETRRLVMTQDRFFKAGLKGIDPRLKVIAIKLERVRRKIVSAYMTAEKDIATIDHTAANAIYAALVKAYKSMAKKLSKQGSPDFAPLNAKFIKPQEEPQPAYDGLSLDSRRSQLGKRTREDVVVRRAFLANDADKGESSSASVKRVKREEVDADPNPPVTKTEEDERKEQTIGGDDKTGIVTAPCTVPEGESEQDD